MPNSFPHLLLLCIIAVNTSVNSFSQSRYGIQLDTNELTILSSKQGILYRGIDNYIQIAATLESRYDTIIVKTNNGKVFSNQHNILIAIPSKIGKIRFMLYGVNHCDTFSLGYTYFEVQGIPEPKLTINNKPISTPCVVTKRMLMNCDSLGIYYSQDIVGSDKWLKITRFILGYSYGGFYVSHINHSNIFSNETKAILSHLGPDREIGILPIVEGEGDIFKRMPLYRITVY